MTNPTIKYDSARQGVHIRMHFFEGKKPSTADSEFWAHQIAVVEGLQRFMDKYTDNLEYILVENQSND